MNTMQASQLCRLCLGGGETLDDIFGENEYLSFVEGYIQDLLQFRAVKDVRFPWLICSTCLGKLNDFRHFKINCILCKKTFERCSLQVDFEPSNTKRCAEIKEEVEEENVEPDASLDVKTNNMGGMTNNEWIHNEELSDLDVRPSSMLPPQDTASPVQEVPLTEIEDSRSQGDEWHYQDLVNCGLGAAGDENLTHNENLNEESKSLGRVKIMRDTASPVQEEPLRHQCTKAEIEDSRSQGDESHYQDSVNCGLGAAGDENLTLNENLNEESKSLGRVNIMRVPNSSLHECSHSSTYGDLEDDTDFRLLLESDSDESIGVPGDNRSEGDGCPLFTEGSGEEGDVFSTGPNVPEKYPLEPSQGGAVFMSGMTPTVDPPELQTGKCIPPVEPNAEPDRASKSTNVRRSRRVKNSIDHSNYENVIEKRCGLRSVRSKLARQLNFELSHNQPKDKMHVCDRVSKYRVKTVGREEDAISSLDAKASDMKKRTRSQLTLGFEPKVHQGRQRREGEGVSDETLLPQGTEAEDEEISNRNHTKKTLHKIASKASLTEDKREKRREYYRKYYHSLNEEKRRSLNRCKSESKRMRLSLMTEEERKEFNRCNNEANRMRRSLMTEEERKDSNRRKYELQKRRLSLMTEEKRKEFYRRKNDAVRRYRNSYDRRNIYSDDRRKKKEFNGNERVQRHNALMNDEEKEDWRKKNSEKQNVNILPP